MKDSFLLDRFVFCVPNLEASACHSRLHAWQLPLPLFPPPGPRPKGLPDPALTVQSSPVAATVISPQPPFFAPPNTRLPRLRSSIRDPSLLDWSIRRRCGCANRPFHRRLACSDRVASALRSPFHARTTWACLLHTRRVAPGQCECMG